MELLNAIKNWRKVELRNDRLIGFQYSISIKNYTIPVLCDSDFDKICLDLFDDIRSQDQIDGSRNKSSTYNRQWRHFGSSVDCENGVDQITSLIALLREKPSDRRKLLVAWNASERETQASTHCLFQFHVKDGHLSCKLYQSWADLREVLQYDCGKAVLLTYLLCHVTGLLPGTFIHSFGELRCDVKEIDVRFVRVRLSEECRDLDRMTMGHCQRESVEQMAGKFALESGRICTDEAGRHEELQYIDLVKDILENGTVTADRTGCGTMSIFGPQMVFSLHDGILPLLTTKRVFYRGIIEELLWFLRGSTNGNELAACNVHIWDANGSKEFLTRIGLGHRQEGDLGPIYGFQWRHSGARYVDMHTDYAGQGVDQIANVIEAIRRDPHGRNHIVMAWNPADLPLMALPPCHCMMQFFVDNGDELSCKLYQRSGDMGLGVPFNIGSYALLTHMVAHVVGLRAGRFILTLGDAHVYLNHIEPIKAQLSRDPRPFPTLKFRRDVSRIDDFNLDDFLIENYEPHPKIAMEMAV